MILDTANHCSVSLGMDGQIRVLNPVPLMNRPLSPDDALVVAAWLAALADPGGDRFAEILREVQET